MTKANDSGPTVPPAGASGPRTPEGIDKAKLNATKHGIFSSAAVMKGEARAEFEDLLRGLHEACRPKGTLEETLVDKLATTLWRHRRLIVAEGAEILRNVALLKQDLEKRRQEEVKRIEESLKPEDGESLLKHISHPGVVERCLELLIVLRDRVKEEESPLDTDFAIITKLFGSEPGGNEDSSSVGSLETWFDVIEAPPDVRHNASFRTAYASKDEILRKLSVEIERLREIQESQARESLARNRTEVLRLSINEGVGLERLVRYEASLERAFDRTLAQLERLQRMRLGQPVAPRVEVGLNY